MTWFCQKSKSLEIGKFVILFFYYLTFSNRYKSYSFKPSGRHLEYFYSPLDGMLVHRRVTPRIKLAGTRHLYTLVERGTVRVKCLALEHNTMSPTRARTPKTRSADDRTNREASTPLLHSTAPFFLLFTSRNCCVCLAASSFCALLLRSSWYSLQFMSAWIALQVKQFGCLHTGQ